MADQEPPSEPASEPASEQGSSYAGWEQRPALGRRGLILAVVVPVLIAAVGFSIVSWVSRGSETQATTVRVPTSGWIPGQAGGTETIRGQVSVDERHCVYLADVAGQRIWPIWPAGYYARIDGAGHVSLYDGGDHLVAREGQLIQASGTNGSASAYEGETCLPSDGKVAVIESRVGTTD